MHITRWDAHATIANTPPFHGEMSYNDEYMVWFRPCTLRHITKESLYWDTLDIDHVEEVVVEENRDTCLDPDPTLKWFTKNT
ncbi:hypothetical protein CFP56_033267 [Quercus suber]|uniref:Uncharacterized protein n=1 Tax=Quercus suber TaxID=58331 RepID=A0AAW0MC06_QUESU